MNAFHSKTLYARILVLVITWLKVRFSVNFLNFWHFGTFLKITRVIYRKYRHMQIWAIRVVTGWSHQINKRFVSKYVSTAGNYKSVSGKLQNSRQLQNNSVNGAVLITVNRVVNWVIASFYLHWMPCLWDHGLEYWWWDKGKHCIKGVWMRSFSGLYFLAFGLNDYLLGKSP